MSAHHDQSENGSYVAGSESSLRDTWVDLKRPRRCVRYSAVLVPLALSLGAACSLEVDEAASRHKRWTNDISAGLVHLEDGTLLSLAQDALSEDVPATHGDCSPPGLSGGQAVSRFYDRLSHVNTFVALDEERRPWVISPLRPDDAVTHLSARKSPLYEHGPFAGIYGADGVHCGLKGDGKVVCHVQPVAKTPNASYFTYVPEGSDGVVVHPLKHGRPLGIQARFSSLAVHHNGLCGIKRGSAQVLCLEAGEQRQGFKMHPIEVRGEQFVQLTSSSASMAWIYYGLTQRGNLYAWRVPSPLRFSYRHSLVADDMPAQVYAPWLMPQHSRAGTEEVALGELHACDRHASGAVRCWGSAVGGKLGLGHLRDGDKPALLPRRVAAGQHPFRSIALGNDHSCASDGAGAAYCWGFNRHGPVGSAEAGADFNMPTRVHVPNGASVFVDKVVASGASTCAVVRGRESPAGPRHLSCWGEHLQIVPKLEGGSSRTLGKCTLDLGASRILPSTHPQYGVVLETPQKPGARQVASGAFERECRATAQLVCDAPNDPSVDMELVRHEVTLSLNSMEKPSRFRTLAAKSLGTVAAARVPDGKAVFDLSLEAQVESGFDSMTELDCRFSGLRFGVRAPPVNQIGHAGSFSQATALPFTLKTE